MEKTRIKRTKADSGCESAFGVPWTNFLKAS